MNDVLADMRLAVAELLGRMRFADLARACRRDVSEEEIADILRRHDAVREDDAPVATVKVLQ
jgi:hypothetical protein